MTVGPTRRVWLGAIAAVVLLVAGCRDAPSPPAVTSATPPPQRIVSLAPALTSMLFRLGLGAQVVGVTRYCDDPPEAATRPKIGGFADPDLEAIVTLRPDLVVGVESPGEAAVAARLQGLGVRTLAVRQGDLAATWAALSTVGDATGKRPEADRLATEAQSALKAAAADCHGLQGKRALFVYGRNPMVISGPGSYGDELLRLVGAVNVAGGLAQAYPKITAEELVRLRPEILLDATMDGGAGGDFAALPGLPGLRVEKIDQPGLLQPGLRVAEGLRALAGRFP